MTTPAPPAALPTTAYKILTADQWAQLQADGLFHGAPIDMADGYIHMSAATEVQGTLDKYFTGPDGLEPGLMIAEVDLSALGDAVRWEVSRGGALFPHLYGLLSLRAVRWVKLLPLDADGRHVFPPLEA